ncbi:phytanoyl-CoA dioxygenase family protein [Rheinheimera texasensis]|uniref:phytanoyl-CoA dioxygenase family protein n=1 Tax=Rheinheimera texasensis TaxID=306205 RepID=UPI0004E27B9A|nr:phytanoyl-CoA dioxygenase family protein [Rheinheimera texasensis]
MQPNQELYNQEGILKIQLGASVMELKLKLAEEICAWLAYWGYPYCRPSSLATDLMQIARSDRALLGKLYKVCRRFPSIKQLAAAPDFVRIAGQLMASPLVSCCNFVCLRFDIPGEDKYLLGIHQDFPYIQGSENGLTFWLALGDVELEMGPPAYVKGSHLNGTLHVTEKKLSDTYGKNGGSTIQIANLDLMKDCKFENEAVSDHECLVFSTLLLHRSEQNVSNKVRISLQLRFDDLCNIKSFERNYPEGLYLGNQFSDSYPEYIR